MLLPVELRERVINAFNNRKSSVEALANEFQVAISTIYEWLKLLSETGSLESRGHGGGRKLLIEGKGLKVLKSLVKKEPDATLDELKQKYNKKMEADVSISTIDRALKRLNLTFKKNISDKCKPRAEASKDRDISQ
jgi:transposase